MVSGVLIWWGQTLQARELITPDWLRPAIIVHGCLNPLLCILFGVLLRHHIRIGWALRANLISGFAVELIFAGLILSGLALYYVGAEGARDTVRLIHRVLGLLLPLSLLIHWVAGLRWGHRAAQGLAGSRSADREAIARQ